ncbi:GNAT family N-acetyltransferase [Mycobacterium sp. BMJ-28]
MNVESLADMSNDGIGIEKQVRSQVERSGADSLPVTAMAADDLRSIAWSGSPTHIKHVEAAWKSGSLEYLVVRAPSGQPISIGAIDYQAHEGAGTLTQLATMPELQGLGVGSRLVSQLEERIRVRGLSSVLLAVEENNPRAQKLYDRLGYEIAGKAEESWESEDDNGNRYTHVANVVLMKKELLQ